MSEFLIAIAGTPNTGKTTLFNALTGANQRTGNWPGVTVEKKEGQYLHGDVRYHLVDLPGTYSLTSLTPDERITRDFLVSGGMDAVIVTLDASNLERGLFFLTLILEMGRNAVAVLNMMDLAREKGMEIDLAKLEAFLGVPFVPTVAVKRAGIEALKTAVAESVREKRCATFRLQHEPEVQRKIDSLAGILSTHLPGYPPAYAVLRVIERDAQMLSLLEGAGAAGQVERAVSEIEQAVPDPEGYFVEKRYGVIHGLVKECVSVRSRIGERMQMTDRADRVFTHPVLGIPLFVLFMWLSFQAVFAWGGAAGNLLHRLFHLTVGGVTTFLTMLHVPDWVLSLVRDGVFAGITSVVVFLPNILILFLVLSFLEESGYMARAAFVMDGLMHRIGLHGKSAIPMILGFGCNVPAIMATRTLESSRERILTILINPFMSCSARLPVYILFTGIFFPQNRGGILLSLYLLGIVLAVLSARLFNLFFFRRQESAPLILELPPYRFPTAHQVFFFAWNRVVLFLKKAGTVILVASVIIWLLNYDFPGAETGSGSLLKLIGGWLAPALRPAGFGFWQAAVALLAGIVAKETVVGTFGTLYGGDAGMSTALAAVFSPASAYAFMIMTLLYIPCIATIATIRQEAGWKWAAFAVVWSLAAGWSVAVVFYQIATRLIPAAL